ncbi:preprotein translocase subunit SecE [Spirochaetota bacterium]
MNRFFQFVKECKRELAERTTWPSKDEVLNSTIIVIVSIIVISISLGFIDYSLSRFNHFVIIENIYFLRKYITPINLFATIAIVAVVVFIYNRIKKKIRQ